MVFLKALRLLRFCLSKDSSGVMARYCGFIILRVFDFSPSEGIEVIEVSTF